MIADSDVLIDALRGRSPARERIEIELGTGHLATTVVNVFELRSGARTPRERAKVEALLAALQVLPLDEAAANDAAAIRLHLEAAGTPIGMADYLIAGICRSRRSTLLTFNREHFSRVPDLALTQMVRARPKGPGG